jgi:asparagine synthetase B (glutamine-hydrolysing)
VSVSVFLKQVVVSEKRIRRTDTGAQPLVSDDGKVILAVNGEIYNHVKLRAGAGSGYKFKTHSDCEVIIPLVRGVRADTASPIISCCAQVSKTRQRPLPSP